MRKQFVLIYSDVHPVSADIIREDNVSQPTPERPEDAEDDDDQIAEADPNFILEVGARVQFVWPVNKEDKRTDRGVVLKIGTQVSLKKLGVKNDGTLLPEGSTEPKLGTKKKELEKIEYNVNHAQDNLLQGVAEEILQNGVGTAASSRAGVVLPSERRLPKKYSPERIQELNQKLNSLSCYRRGPGKIEVWKESGVYVDYGAITTLKLQYCRPSKIDPASLYRGIIRLLVPQEILMAKGLSSTGTRGCIRFPKKLVDCAVSHVKSAVIQAKGDPDKINYNPMKVLRTMMSNETYNNPTTRKKVPSTRTSSASQSSTSPPGSSTSSPRPSPASSPHPSLSSPSSSPRGTFLDNTAYVDQINVASGSSSNSSFFTTAPSNPLRTPASHSLQSIATDHAYGSPSPLRSYVSLDNQTAMTKQSVLPFGKY